MDLKSKNKKENDINLTIKEADKGDVVIVMDTEYYKSLIFSMLENNTY